MATTTTKTEKMVKLLSKRAATSDQIAQHCGFASRSSVTSAIASLRSRGVNIRGNQKNKDGLVRYTLA